MLIAKYDQIPFFEWKGSGPREDHKDVPFETPITNAVAMLTGMNAEYSRKQDHAFGNLQVDVTCAILDPMTVRVTATYGLRDWTGTWDDYYDGTVYFVVVAESDVGNDQLADMPNATIKGRESGTGTGPPQDLTATQATAILDAFEGDSGTGGKKGLVPAPDAGDAAAHKLLAASGGWVAPVTPARTLFVATSWPSGADPSIYFTTIGAALNQAGTMTPEQVNPVAISISPGKYNENVALQSWVFLSSASTDQNAVTIKGDVTWILPDTSNTFEVVQLYFLNIAGLTTVTTNAKKPAANAGTQDGQTSFILHGCFLDDLEVNGRSATDLRQRDFVFGVTSVPRFSFTLDSCLFEWVAGRLNGMTFNTTNGDCHFRIIGSTTVPTATQPWSVNGKSTGICTGSNFTTGWTLNGNAPVVFAGCSLSALTVASATATADIRSSECPKLKLIGPGAVNRRSLTMSGVTTAAGPTVKIDPPFLDADYNVSLQLTGGPGNSAVTTSDKKPESFNINDTVGNNTYDVTVIHD